MAIIEIKIKNLPALKRAFRDYGKISEPILEQAIQGSVATLAKHTTRSTVPWRTGLMTKTFIQNSGRLWARWSPTRRYAIFVHEGTRPHIIRYTKAGRGGLYDKKTKQGFGRVVHHPGTRAQPFMKTIAAKASADINKLFGQAYDKIMGQIAKSVNAEA